ncbi:hypothetical protein AK812_SmicGene28558 [Symbiodinium microadriaticum]|uniref:Uncharacterized protein n=1 Tax=Symbiodinium microadriaticum TaxID=2951 RepID=A0A1Q9D466_SYMMI|nr:hypothetical protein AK812_SmicGene28558 [Symbiodinium microadriaticum]
MDADNIHFTQAREATEQMVLRELHEHVCVGPMPLGAINSTFHLPPQLMTQFLDVSHDVAKGDLDIDNLKGIFKNKAWSDLPVFMKLQGNPNFNYKTQYFIQEQSNGNYTVIKHVFLLKQRLPQTKREAFAMGKCYEIAWGQGNKFVERKALQWMLEQTGGLQFRQFSLSTERKRPMASSAMGTPSP